MSLENEMSDFRSFLKALQQRLEERVDFEVVEAYLNAFLKVCGHFGFPASRHVLMHNH